MKTYTPLLLLAGLAALWYFWPDLQSGRNKTATALADAQTKADALDAANKKLQADLDAQTKAADAAAAKK
jgi:hypothetical protein